MKAMEIYRAAVHESVFADSKCFVRSPDVPRCTYILYPDSRQSLKIAPVTELESLSRLSGSELPTEFVLHEARYLH
jgi:hypothetical protein